MLARKSPVQPFLSLADARCLANGQSQKRNRGTTQDFGRQAFCIIPDTGLCRTGLCEVFGQPLVGAACSGLVRCTRASNVVVASVPGADDYEINAPGLIGETTQRKICSNNHNWKSAEPGCPVNLRQRVSRSVRRELCMAVVVGSLGPGPEEGVASAALSKPVPLLPIPIGQAFHQNREGGLSTISAIDVWRGSRSRELAAFGGKSC